jgi:hypothetical protein
MYQLLEQQEKGERYKGTENPKPFSFPIRGFIKPTHQAPVIFAFFGF